MIYKWGAVLGRRCRGPFDFVLVEVPPVLKNVGHLPITESAFIYKIFYKIIRKFSGGSCKLWPYTKLQNPRSENKRAL